MRKMVVLVLLLSAPNWAHARPAPSEYFGRFLDELKGTFIADAKPRPTFRLQSDFRFEDPNGNLWTAPAHTVVDGASIPAIFWSGIGGPFEGEYLSASVIHDYYCEVKTKTAHDTHRAFYYGMKAAKVPDWKAKFMYWAVATFGPQWKLEKRVVLDTVCEEAARPTCKSVAEHVDQIVDQPAVDLQDPQVLAVALSKARSVARTLKTSDGQFLDAASNGTVLASLDSIDANASSYQKIFLARSFEHDPAELGVLSEWAVAADGDIPDWRDDVVPSMEGSPFLRLGTIAAVENGSQFRLDAAGQGLLEERLTVERLSGELSVH